MIDPQSSADWRGLSERSRKQRKSGWCIFQLLRLTSASRSIRRKQPFRTEHQAESHCPKNHRRLTGRRSTGLGPARLTATMVAAVHAAQTGWHVDIGEDRIDIRSHAKNTQQTQRLPTRPPETGGSEVHLQPQAQSVTASSYFVPVVRDVTRRLSEWPQPTHSKTKTDLIKCEQCL